MKDDEFRLLLSRAVYGILGILFGVRNVVNLSFGMAAMLIISMVPRDPNSTERWAIASLSGASTMLTKS